MNVASAQTQVDTAQQQADATETSYQASERVLSDVESRVNKGENCIIRKKRGFFKKIFREIGRGIESVGKGIKQVVTKEIPKGIRTVVNLPCQIFINIGNLRGDRDRARNERDAAITRRQNAQQNLANYIAARDTVQQQLRDLTAKRDGLTVTIGQLNDEKVKAISINEKIKNVIVHLSGLLDRGHMLQDVLRKLIDMEILVNPLNEVSELLVAFSTRDDGSVASTLESYKTQIRNDVRFLKQNCLPIH